MVITGCSKGGNSINPPPDPPPASASISWTVDPTDTKRKDTSFYLENRNVSIVLLNATSGGIDGVTGTSTTTGLMTNPKTFTAWAKNSAGAMVTSSKTIPLYTQNKTNLVGNGQGLVKWVPDSTRFTIVSDSLIEPAPNAVWGTSVMSSVSFRFYTNGIDSVYGGPIGTGYSYYSLLSGDNWIFFQTVPQKIYQLTPTLMILQWWQKDPFSPIMFCGRSWYHGVP